MPARAFLHGALLSSGAAALVYESTWTRMLHRVFGVGDAAVATVLAVFFLGLGLGSAASARFAPRVARPGLVFIALEASIGLYALLSLWLIPQGHGAYAALGSNASFGVVTLLRAALSVLLLLPPTLLMGASLPVAALILAGRGATWARDVTGLYVSNTLGAVLGAGAAGFWLLPFVGTRNSVALAALASFAAAAGVALTPALRAARAGKPAPGPPVPAEPAAPGPGMGPASTPARVIGLATLLAALTGLAALAGEVLWTRVLRSLIHGTTQAFAAMLVNYLVGIALGGLLVRRLSRSRIDAAAWFGALQIVSAGLVVAAMTITPQLPRLLPLLRGDMNFHVTEVRIILLLSGLLLLPLATAVGTGLPLAWSLAERALRDAGAGSGRILAANTLGALVGALGAGFALIPWLGTETSLLGVACIHLLAAAIALGVATGASGVRRGLALAGPLAAGALLLASPPSIELPFLLGAREHPREALLHGPDPSFREELAFLREGRNTTVTVVRGPGGLRLFNDGLPESGLKPGVPGFGSELALLGSLPSLFARERERALVVGLGGGHTATVMLAGPWKRIDVVELEEAVIDAARVLHAELERPFPLDTPRVNLIVDDARSRLALTPPASLDAVVSQPSHPWLAGSGALYTAEFFADVRRALRAGGVFVLWVNLFQMDDAHLRSIVGTLTDAFPHVLGFVVEKSSLILTASQAPLEWGAPLAERLRRIDEGGAFLTAHGLGSVPELAAHLELDAPAARAYGSDAPRVVDDRPTLEFELPRLPIETAYELRDLDAALAEQPWLARDTLALFDPEGLGPCLFARVEAVEDRPRALMRVGSTPAAMPPDVRHLVEGRLNEAGGEIEAALRHYDASAAPEAAERADALRLAEGLPGRALDVAARRATTPRSAEPLLLAALTVGTPEAIAVALRVARRAGAAADVPLLQLVASYGEGCDRLGEAPERLALLSREHPAVAAVALRCAAARGDDAEAQQLALVYAGLRRARAEQDLERSEASLAGGNGGAALVYLRRAVRAAPDDSRAVTSLAELLHQLARADEARRALETGLAETADPEARGRIQNTARKLGLELTRDARPATGSPG